MNTRVHDLNNTLREQIQASNEKLDDLNNQLHHKEDEISSLKTLLENEKE